MKFYFISNRDGSLLHTGGCPDSEIENQVTPPDATMVLGELPEKYVRPSKQHLWIDGEWKLDDTLAKELAANAYKQLRVNEYPKIGDQLDALFKAGLFPPEMEARIAAVKAKYPKPTEA